MPEQKHDDQDKQKMSDKDWEEWGERVSRAMMDFHPYDRELFEKMTREERKAYNNAFKLTGLILVIAGIVLIPIDMLLGSSKWDSLLAILIGIGMLFYWNDPFCYSKLWDRIVKLFARHDF